MNRWFLGMATAVLLGGAWFARGIFFQSEAVRVERLLQQVATDVSFNPQEGNVACVRRISGVINRFTSDATIEVELLGVGTFNLAGRDEIQQALLGARRAARRLALKFHDLVIQIEEDGQTAEVHLTATSEAEGRGRNQDGFEALEFNFKLRKLEGGWFIQQITTIPTLKQ